MINVNLSTMERNETGYSGYSELVIEGRYYIES